MHTTTPAISTRPYFLSVWLSVRCVHEKLDLGTRLVSTWQNSKCCVYISCYATVLVATLPACLQLQTFTLWYHQVLTQGINMILAG